MTENDNEIAEVVMRYRPVSAEDPYEHGVTSITSNYPVNPEEGLVIVKAFVDHLICNFLEQLKEEADPEEIEQMFRSLIASRIMAPSGLVDESDYDWG